jgi:hypothetical protein
MTDENIIASIYRDTIKVRGVLNVASIVVEYSPILTLAIKSDLNVPI